MNKIITTTAIALFLVGVATAGTVKADRWTSCHWDHTTGQVFCEPGPYFAYTQHPTVHQVDSNWACKGDPDNGPYNCQKIWPYNGGQQEQPTLQAVALVQQDNCFWSYPVQCN
jgi:hypothetical protein